MPRFHTLCATFTAAALAAGASAAIVNVDIEAGEPSDTTHVGDDGPLSTAGGTLWTSVLSATGATDLPTEFGGASPFDVVYTLLANPATFSDPGINNLQDSGDFGIFEIRDLLPGQIYELAVYCGENAGFGLRDDNGTRPFFASEPQADGWSLPGTEGSGGDYFYVTNVAPTELSLGVWGVEINPDGVITGFQISGPVPEPGSAALFALASLLLRRRT